MGSVEGGEVWKRKECEKQKSIEEGKCECVEGCGRRKTRGKKKKCVSSLFHKKPLNTQSS